MTEDERIARAAIADTLAICGQAGDAGKTEAYVACFAEDGVLDLGDDGKIAGREALRAWMNAPSAFAQPEGAPLGAARLMAVPSSGARAARSRTSLRPAMSGAAGQPPLDRISRPAAS